MWNIWNERNSSLYNSLLYYLYLVREEPSQETQTWSKRSETLSPPPSKSLQAPTLLEWPLALPYVIAVQQFGIHPNTTIITTNSTSYNTEHGLTPTLTRNIHTTHRPITLYLESNWNGTILADSKSSSDRWKPTADGSITQIYYSDTF
jgi:hypothetical protein